MIDTQTLNKISLPFKGISTVTFLGNYFYDKTLVLVHTNEIILYNTQNGLHKRYDFPERNVSWSSVNPNGDLQVNLINRKTGETGVEVIEDAF